MGVFEVDTYYQRKREILNDRNAIVPKIYCDASYKDNVMVAAIMVFDNTGNETKTQVVESEEIIDGEVAAIKLGLNYIESHFLKEAILYTEIDDVIHTHTYTVINQIKDIKFIPYEYRGMYANHRSFWAYFRFLHRQSHIVLEKVKSANNPAHAIACQKREELLHNKIKSKLKAKIAIICTHILKWAEK